jgi:hypothetical protein
MAHKLTWYSLDCKTANLIDYVIVNRRLAGAIQYTRLHGSAVVYVKNKNHLLIVSRVNLKLKFQKVNFFLGFCDVARFQDGNQPGVAGFVLNPELSRVVFYPHLYGLF